MEKGASNKMSKFTDFLNKAKDAVFPSTKEKTEKEIATDKGEPYIKVIEVVFPEMYANRGSFDFFCNYKFFEFLR